MNVIGSTARVSDGEEGRSGASLDDIFEGASEGGRTGWWWLEERENALLDFSQLYPGFSLVLSVMKEVIVSRAASG